MGGTGSASWLFEYLYRCAHLLLDELLLLGLEQFLRHALGACLGTETQLPKLQAKWRGVFVEEASKLDLHGLDVGLYEGNPCQHVWTMTVCYFCGKVANAHIDLLRSD